MEVRGDTDTLWPQSKCCNPPSNLTGKISDLDDNFLTGQQVAAAFPGNSTFSSVPNTVTVIGGTYFIEGQMNLANISLKFIGSTLIMGSGTVIYLGEGFLPPAKFSIDDVHINGTSCGMWRGIKAPGDGRISLKNSYISDAEIAVEATNCKFSIECSNTEFNNNVIGIYYPQDIGSPNSFIDILGYSSTFSSSTFQSSSPMTLAYFNGQHEFPLDKKPYAGMVLNDLVPSLPGLPSIPFSINTTPCIFNNMNYGIYARNSQLDVFNCQFKNINRSPSYVAVDFTCAVYSDNACSYCQSVFCSC